MLGKVSKNTHLGLAIGAFYTCYTIYSIRALKNIMKINETRIQTHAVLLLTLTLMLTFQLKTTSLVGFPRSFPIPSLNTLGSFVFELSLTLTFQPKNIPLAGYPNVIPYIKFEHFGIICLSYAPDISVKNILTLTFELPNSTTSSVSQSHSLY